MSRKKVSAIATLHRDTRKGRTGVRTEVPRVAIRTLGGRDCDRLIFEEGSLTTVQEASLKGTYFVVRLERAPQAEAQPVVAEPTPAPSAPLGSFADEVQ